jgi:trehalose/maltose transport system substrate-binding protein
VVHKRVFALFLMLALLLPLLAACGGGGQEPAPGAEESPAAPPAESPAASPAAPPAASPAASPGASPAAGGGGASAEEIDVPMPISADNPPPVENVEEAKQYSGQKVTYIGAATDPGLSHQQTLARKFSEETGIQVEIVPGPQSATEKYSQYQRFFQARSPDIDAMEVDVVWPGAFAPHLIDLNPKLGEFIKEWDYNPVIVENNTVDGKLVGLPWFYDFGILYYRTDLLEKYNFDQPPQTWDELEQMAQTIQDGEREAGSANFWGFVFQGKAYEGLTCDALEWAASSGGGTFVDENGEVTINNPQAAAAFNKAQGWVGTIAPPGVTTYEEPDAHNAFNAGNAAFMRNWPYAYQLANTTDIRGKFDVAPLPHGEGGESVGTIGGWQLSVSEYSDAKDAAVEWIRYLGGPAGQVWMLTLMTQLPSSRVAAQHPAIREAVPYLDKIEGVRNVPRPSGPLGENYNEGSTAIFQGVNQILIGQNAEQVLPQVERRLQRILR